MTETSRFWNGTTVGDASSAPYDGPTEFAQAEMALSGSVVKTNKGGVWYDDLNKLAVTSPAANTLRVATGHAHVYGTWYENDANVDVTIATPSGATRIDRVVLRKDWNTQTVRVTLIAGTEGGGAPALTQSIGVTWDFPLAQASITTGGVITLTDQRVFLNSSQPVTGQASGSAVSPAIGNQPTFVDLTDMSVILTTLGGDVVVSFNNSFEDSIGSLVYHQVLIDGATASPTDGAVAGGTAGVTFCAAATFRFTGLTAASHTFEIQWRNGGGATTTTAATTSRNMTVRSEEH